MTAQADRRRALRRCRAAGAECRVAHRRDGEVQFKSPGMFVGYFREDDKTRETMTDDGYVKTGDAGFFEPDGPAQDHRPRQGRRPARARADVRAQIHREQAEVLPEHPEAVAIGDGRDFVAAMINIELASVDNWAERNNVSYALLPGAGRKPAASTP